MTNLTAMTWRVGMAIRLRERLRNSAAAARSKLANPSIEGQPEDQLRAPLEVFVKDVAHSAGFTLAVDLVGETALSELRVRPDYAVTVSSALVGFIEVKAPGKGADPRRFTDPHDKDPVGAS